MTGEIKSELYNTKKQIAIQITKRILLEEKEKGNIYVPILDGDKMEDVVKISLAAVEKLTSITKGDNLYGLPYDTIVRKIMEQIAYCAPFHPQKKTLDLDNFTVTCANEVSTILAQKVVDVVELTTGYLITERADRNLSVPAHISDDDVMGLVVEIIKNRETLKTLTNGTSVFEQNKQLLMNTIIEQMMDYMPTEPPINTKRYTEHSLETEIKHVANTEIFEEKTPETEVKPADDKKKSKKEKSTIRRLFGFFSSRVSRRQ